MFNVKCFLDIIYYIIHFVYYDVIHPTICYNINERVKEGILWKTKRYLGID